MTAPSTDRVAEIAAAYADADYRNPAQLSHVLLKAIRAALADPLVTESIRAEERERAAKAAIEAVADCEGTIASQNFVAAAILAMED